nr:MAG TPA: hypothetical protein [Caudoviricetes sp.]
MTPRPGIIDFFRGNRTTEPVITGELVPVITGELVPVTGSEVEPVTPKNENLIDFQKTLYDEWLADWFKAGKLPTHSYDYEKGFHFVEVRNPERVNFPTENMYGALSRSFVLSEEWDINEHAHRFVGGHNHLFGWDRHGTPVHYRLWVPVYDNTIDKVIIEHNRPANIANRLAEWLDNEREKDIKWQMEMNAHAAKSEYTKARIEEAMRNL